MKRAAMLLSCFVSVTVSAADAFDYRLGPRRIAPDTYVFIGRTEDFNVANGGNIVNTGFIVTTAGVVVIDTGPSKRYGEQMRAAIARVTDKPIVQVFNTHHHPDHYLGNQAFAEVGANALPATTQGVAAEGKAFAENMYRLSGDWMLGTESTAPTANVTEPEIAIGDHRFRLLALAGHTAGDLAIYDTTTQVVFAGDLVFNRRTLTTPHADPARWLQSLDRLGRLKFKRLVPGHGEVATDATPIAETRDYLTWLVTALLGAAERGLDMTEAMALPPPERFRGFALLDTEYRRSVVHLYPAMERATLHNARKE